MGGQYIKENGQARANVRPVDGIDGPPWTNHSAFGFFAPCCIGLCDGLACVATRRLTKMGMLSPGSLLHSPSWHSGMVTCAHSNLGLSPTAKLASGTSPLPSPARGLVVGPHGYQPLTSRATDTLTLVETSAAKITGNRIWMVGEKEA
jgi:hypothetical protein